MKRSQPVHYARAFGAERTTAYSNGTMGKQIKLFPRSFTCLKVLFIEMTTLLSLFHLEFSVK